MNSQDNPNAIDSPPDDLPELTDERIDAIENALFLDIARDRADHRARGSRRNRLWLVGGAAAAVIVVAAVIAPSVGSIVGSGGGFSAADESTVDPGVSLLAPQDASRDAEAVAPDAAGAGQAVESSTAQRDIITTGSASLVVADVPDAARAIGDAAAALGGYVESMSVGGSGEVMPVDSGVVSENGGRQYIPYPIPYPVGSDGGWVTVRVPAAELQGLIEGLAGFGEVTASSISRQDVTEQTVDLRARVDAAQASVDRVTQLMAQAGSLTDLIAAESALAERQATLESYQQQLKYYDEQVALSTLSVSLATPANAVEADPAGFTDGLAAGWNGLVATLNGIVIALGFLIPWILVLAVAGSIVWGVVRLARRRRNTTATPPASAPAPSETD